MPTDKFFGFIKDPAIKQKVSYFLLDQLRLGGAEYAHVNRTQDFDLIGIDSLNLYAANIKAYQDAAKNRKEIEADLNELFGKMAILANQYFPRELKQWLRLKELASKGKLPLLDYLKKLRSLDVTTGAGRSSQEYPALSILLAAETIKDQKLIVRLNALDFRVVFEEITRWEKDFSNRWLHHEKDKQIFDYYQGLALLKRLNRIELTQAEYEAVEGILQKIKTREIADFIASLTHQSLVLSREWEQHIKDAIQFYAAAQSRDRSIRQSLENFLENEKEDTAVLVFGGFHANAIKELFREQGISYIVASPKISRVDKKHQGYYRELMSVGHQPFEAPFLAARAAKPPSIFYSATGAGTEASVRFELRAIADSVEALGTHSDPELIERSLARFNQVQEASSAGSLSKISKVRSEGRMSEPGLPILGKTPAEDQRRAFAWIPLHVARSVPQIDNIAVSLTNWCPVRCAFCFMKAVPDKKKSQSLSDEALGRVLRYAEEKRVRRLDLYGGEALGEMDAVLRSIREAAVQRISITTSGYFAGTEKHTEEVLDRLLTALEERVRGGKAPVKIDFFVSFDEFHARVPRANIIHIIKIFENYWDTKYSDFSFELRGILMPSDPIPGLVDELGGRIVENPKKQNAKIEQVELPSGYRFKVKYLEMKLLEDMLDTELANKDFDRVYEQRLEEDTLFVGRGKEGGVSLDVSYDGTVTLQEYLANDFPLGNVNDEHAFQEVDKRLIWDPLVVVLREIGLKTVLDIAARLRPKIRERSIAANNLYLAVSDILADASLRDYVYRELIQLIERPQGVPTVRSEVRGENQTVAAEPDKAITHGPLTAGSLDAIRQIKRKLVEELDAMRIGLEDPALAEIERVRVKWFGILDLLEERVRRGKVLLNSDWRIRRSERGFPPVPEAVSGELVMIGLPGTFDPMHLNHIDTLLEALSYVTGLDSPMPKTVAAFVAPLGDLSEGPGGGIWKADKQPAHHRHNVAQRFAEIFSPLIQTSYLSLDYPSGNGIENVLRLYEANRSRFEWGTLFVAGGSEAVRHWVAGPDKQILLSYEKKYPREPLHILVEPETDLVDPSLYEDLPAKVHFLPRKNILDLRSTAVRKTSRFSLFPRGARNYIRQHGLYGASPLFVPQAAGSDGQGSFLAQVVRALDPQIIVSDYDFTLAQPQLTPFDAPQNQQNLQEAVQRLKEKRVLVIETGQPLEQAMVNIVAPLRSALSGDPEALSRFYLVYSQDGGALGFDNNGEMIHYWRPENLPAAQRLQYIQALGASFYQRLGERISTEGARFPVRSEDLRAAKERFEREVDRLSAAGELEKVWSGFSLNIELLPPELIGPAYIQDAGDRVTLELGRAHRDFKKWFDASVRDIQKDMLVDPKLGIGVESLRDIEGKQIKALSGPTFVSIARSVKGSRVRELVRDFIVPGLELRDRLGIVVMGDSSVDVPMMNPYLWEDTIRGRFRSTLRVEVLPVYVGREPDVIMSLGREVVVSPLPATEGGNLVLAAIGAKGPQQGVPPVRLKGGSMARVYRYQRDGVWRVRKEAAGRGRQKLVNEINWILHLPEDLKPHFPEVLTYNMTEETAFYEMPFYGEMMTLTHAIIMGRMSPQEVMAILGRVISFASNEMAATDRQEPPADYLGFIVDKIRRRIAETCQKAPEVFSDLTEAETITINGHEYTNILPLLRRLEGDESLRKMVQPPFFSLLHGDLHLDNILVDEKGHFILFDPRGDPAGDLIYDLGKILHTLSGKYDLLEHDLHTTELRKENGKISIDMKFDHDFTATERYRHLENLLPSLLRDAVPGERTAEDPYWVERLAFIHAHHFSVMMPFDLKLDQVEARAVAIYATGVMLLNTFVDLLGKENATYFGLPFNGNKRSEMRSALEDREVLGLEELFGAPDAESRERVLRRIQSGGRLLLSNLLFDPTNPSVLKQASFRYPSSLPQSHRAVVAFRSSAVLDPVVVPAAYGNVDLLVVPEKTAPFEAKPVREAASLAEIQSPRLGRETLLEIMHQLDMGQHFNFYSQGTVLDEAWDEHSHDPYERELAFMKRDRDRAPMGNLLTEGSAFETDDFGNLYLIHMTTGKQALLASPNGEIYGSPKAIGPVIYSTPVMSDGLTPRHRGGRTTSLLREHWKNLKLRRDIPEGAALRDYYLVFKVPYGSGNVNTASNWIDYLGFGPTNLETLERMKSHPGWTQERKLRMQDEILKQYRAASPFLSRVTDPGTEHNLERFGEFWESFATARKEMPYLNKVFFEIVKSYVLLYQNDEASLRLRDAKEPNLANYYAITYEVAPEMKAFFNTEFFRPDFDALVRAIGGRLRNFEPDHFKRFVVERFHTFAAIKLLEGRGLPADVPDYETLAKSLPNLTGLLVYHVLYHQVLEQDPQFRYEFESLMSGVIREAFAERRILVPIFAPVVPAAETGVWAMPGVTVDVLDVDFEDPSGMENVRFGRKLALSISPDKIVQPAHRALTNSNARGERRTEMRSFEESANLPEINITKTAWAVLKAATGKLQEEIAKINPNAKVTEILSMPNSLTAGLVLRESDFDSTFVVVDGIDQERLNGLHESFRTWLSGPGMLLEGVNVYAPHLISAQEKESAWDRDDRRSMPFVTIYAEGRFLEPEMLVARGIAPLFRLMDKHVARIKWFLSADQIDRAYVEKMMALMERAGEHSDRRVREVEGFLGNFSHRRLSAEALAWIEKLDRVLLGKHREVSVSTSERESFLSVLKELLRENMVRILDGQLVLVWRERTASLGDDYWKDLLAVPGLTSEIGQLVQDQKPLPLEDKAAMVKALGAEAFTVARAIKELEGRAGEYLEPVRLELDRALSESDFAPHIGVNQKRIFAIFLLMSKWMLSGSADVDENVNFLIGRVTELAKTKKVPVVVSKTLARMLRPVYPRISDAATRRRVWTYLIRQGIQTPDIFPLEELRSPLDDLRQYLDSLEGQFEDRLGEIAQTLTGFWDSLRQVGEVAQSGRLNREVYEAKRLLATVPLQLDLEHRLVTVAPGIEFTVLEDGAMVPRAPLAATPWEDISKRLQDKEVYIFDVDDTLIPMHGEVSPEIVDHLVELLNRGKWVVLNTLRGFWPEDFAALKKGEGLGILKSLFEHPEFKSETLDRLHLYTKASTRKYFFRLDRGGAPEGVEDKSYFERHRDAKVFLPQEEGLVAEVLKALQEVDETHWERFDFVRIEQGSLQTFREKKIKLAEEAVFYSPNLDYRIRRDNSVPVWQLRILLARAKGLLRQRLAPRDFAKLRFRVGGHRSVVVAKFGNGKTETVRDLIEAGHRAEAMVHFEDDFTGDGLGHELLSFEGLTVLNVGDPVRGTIRLIQPPAENIPFTEKTSRILADSLSRGRSELREKGTPGDRETRIVRSLWKNAQPAMAFVNAEDFGSFSEAQKREYFFVALSRSETRIIVYNERGQVHDGKLEALLKLERVQRTDSDLDGAVRLFARANVPAVHLSKNMLPSPAQVRSLRRRVSFFKTPWDKSGTLATALLWAISGGEDVRFQGVREEDGFWTVDETLLEAIQRTYENNFAFVIAA
ncbi:MAG: radical SAM protein [Candidatus Omnitrophota bacterium]